MKLTKDNLETVTLEAHRWHMTTLERYGNKPNDTQRTILRELMRMLVGIAAGHTVGRYPWPLATGMGKTTAVIALHRTLEAQEITGVGTATAATQVEALCRLYRDLQAAGVPKEKIGLFHSKKYDANDPMRCVRDSDYASEPATTGNQNRPYVLVTQERVKDIDKFSEYFTYHGNRRQLMIWDESLVASEYWKLNLHSFIGAAGTLSGLAGEYPDLTDMANGFQQYSALLKSELGIARERGKTRYTVLPPVSLETVIKWTALAKQHEYRRLLHQGTLASLGFFNQKVRVYPVNSQTGGLVWYTPTIPSEEMIPSMVILDASFPIRELEQADATLKRVEEDVPTFAEGLVSFHDAKKYDHVTIHQWCRHSGRESMRKDFYGKKPDKPQDEWLEQKKAEQQVVRRVVKVATQIPVDEAMLFFVFKPQQYSQHTYQHILETKLRQAGVDLTATVPVLEYDHEGKPVLVNKPRVCILTFGQETSLNDFSHVQNVILVGILHRDEDDVVPQYVATCDGGDHERLTKKTAQQLVQSEVVHTVYQALSRGCCRITEDGQAKPMKAWIIHYAKDIRRSLGVVMPGAVWVNEWPMDTPTTTNKPKKPLSPEAVTLREYLESLIPEQFPMFAGHVKVNAELSHLSRQAWRRVVDEAIDGTPFKVVNKRFILEPDSILVGTPKLLG
ncbi:MAG: hypothetical protein JSR29_15840 [Nitrospira sp.]|nr:hypothetical protein [Nitrospira sp.]